MQILLTSYVWATFKLIYRFLETRCRVSSLFVIRTPALAANVHFDLFRTWLLGYRRSSTTHSASRKVLDFGWHGPQSTTTRFEQNTPSGHQKAFDEWLDKLARRVRRVMERDAESSRAGIEEPGLLDCVKELKEMIEGDREIYEDVVAMFEGMQKGPRSYQEMLYMFDDTFRRPPEYGGFGPPLYMILARVMNTEGGFRVFTRQALNEQFKKMFQIWEAFLLSDASTEVLHDGEGGWFAQEALAVMLKHYEAGRKFEEVFVADPNAPAYGFGCFEDFFVRRYRSPEIDRPIDSPDDRRMISSPCESTLYAIQSSIKLSDELFIKDEAYSLVHLLAGDESTEAFVGGTVIQTFLEMGDYHRWHSPVDGVVKKIVDVPGTYFAQCPSTLGSDIHEHPYGKSLRYFANTATRQLIFIQAHNAKIGLMCFVAIGMTEVSTCEASVAVDQEVRRGDELGTFHFGGSSCAMVFRKEAKVEVRDGFVEPGSRYPINATIAFAEM